MTFNIKSGMQDSSWYFLIPLSDCECITVIIEKKICFIQVISELLLQKQCEEIFGGGGVGGC